MTLFYAAAAIAVIVAIGLLAVGRLGQLPDPTPDRPGPQLPPGAVSAADLAALRFNIGARGYRMREVDAVLDRLQSELLSREYELAQFRPLVPVEPATAAPAEPAPDAAGEPPH